MGPSGSGDYVPNASARNVEQLARGPMRCPRRDVPANSNHFFGGQFCAGLSLATEARFRPGVRAVSGAFGGAAFDVSVRIVVKDGSQAEMDRVNT